MGRHAEVQGAKPSSNAHATTHVMQPHLSRPGSSGPARQQHASTRKRCKQEAAEQQQRAGNASTHRKTRGMLCGQKGCGRGATLTPWTVAAARRRHTCTGSAASIQREWRRRPQRASAALRSEQGAAWWPRTMANDCTTTRDESRVGPRSDAREGATTPSHRLSSRTSGMSTFVFAPLAFVVVGTVLSPFEHRPYIAVVRTA
jgi:hypothetical protein